MMMPECGDIPISCDPEAKEGFRLGLLEDFSKYDYELEDRFDFPLAACTLEGTVKQMAKIEY